MESYALNKWPKPKWTAAHQSQVQLFGCRIVCHIVDLKWITEKLWCNWAMRVDYAFQVKNKIRQ